MLSQDIPSQTWGRNLPVVEALSLLGKGERGIYLERHLDDAVQTYTVVGGSSQHDNVKSIIVAQEKVFLVCRDDIYRTAFKVSLVDGKPTDAPAGLFMSYSKAVDAVLVCLSPS